ncbi:helix-turn-helix transcriptional regulator [Streptomyces sp. N2-109]|uniref:Helix-turn-helix transcriptional regulator n=1 Tax=Streptomyces gossypii TaxID=2883101 RepID=A0ABT2JLL6_9ACTN|nr:helix-turn-helix transcriptional regulator [Streptomyces gossypii]MCT2588394.1 helix-turn-helix transcriptional regulator [Streptomyces gossypii]
MNEPSPALNGEPANGLEWFGREVEAALAHKGVSQRQLADATGYKEPYVSKVKKGKALPSPQFADGCDRFFNTSGFFARLLVRISQHGHPEWFVPYLELEEKAAQVLDFSPFLVMGVLQIPEYAEALFRAAHPRDPNDVITRKVAARLQRRTVLERPDPPLLWIVLDESCLRREVGGREVMRHQVEHLLSEAQTPNVTVQVLPYDSGAPPAAEAFTLLTFDDDDTAPVLYSEAQGLGRVIDSASVVATGTDRYERLRADALSPEKSLRALRMAIKEYAQ